MSMDSIVKNAKSATPMKDPHGSKSKIQASLENSNPNASQSSPGPKPAKSPLTKSAKAQKSASRNPNPAPYSPRNKIQERKFVVAKKNSKKDKVKANSTVDCKCKERFGGNVKKCLCVAYDSLRASQEKFFKIRNTVEEHSEVMSETCDGAGSEVGEATEKGFLAHNSEIDNAYRSDNHDFTSEVEQLRNRLLEEPRSSVPKSGKVMHLVKAFEKLLSIPNSKESEENKEEKELEEQTKKPMKLVSPILQPPPKVLETQASSSSFCPSEFILTSENLGLDSKASVSSSWNSNRGRLVTLIVT